MQKRQSRELLGCLTLFGNIFHHFPLTLSLSGTQKYRTPYLLRTSGILLSDSKGNRTPDSSVRG